MPSSGKVFVMKKKICKWIAISLGVLFIGIQLMSVKRTNPPITGEIQAPEKVMAILRRCCYDCHSNETKWPWYSYVAPVSWLVSDDVNDGRKHMNFSEWADYNTKQKNHKTKKCGKLVTLSEMPLWFYLPLHPEAELLPEDIETIVSWSKTSQ
jgi:hypothetical protein